LHYEWIDKPLLVYGPPKSGTTLLQNLIDGGPDILMLPGEVKIKYTLKTEYHASWKRIADYLTFGRSIWRDKQIFHNLNASDKSLAYDPEYLDKLDIGTLNFQQIEKVFNVKQYILQLTQLGCRNIATTSDIYQFDLEAYYDALLEKPNYRYWACKEVGGDPKRILPYFKALYPKAKLLLILRSPNFIVRSIILERRRKGIRLSAKEIIKHCHASWSMVQFAYKMREWDDAMICFYEDLVADTGATMRRICEFLNVPFRELYCVTTTCGINSVVSTASVKTSQVFQGTAKNWTNQLHIREALLITGYETTMKRVRQIQGGHHVSLESLRAEYGLGSLLNR
jgi:hypothetical protein